MNAIQGIIRELTPDDLLLRALLSAKMLQNLPDAFLLRQNDRDTGLSVNFDCSAAECRAQFRTTFGVASLALRSVTALDLRVVPDAPHHANIQGLPHKDDDPDMAEWLASRLAESATIIDRGKQERHEG